MLEANIEYSFVCPIAIAIAMAIIASYSHSSPWRHFRPCLRLQGLSDSVPDNNTDNSTDNSNDNDDDTNNDSIIIIVIQMCILIIIVSIMIAVSIVNSTQRLMIITIVRPVCLLRVWVSEGLTQADS